MKYIVDILRFIRKYFADKLSPSVRYLHYFILSFVLLQIITSNFIEISDNGVISHHIFEYIGTWAHISVGLTALFFAIIFTTVELSKHGFLYFYPYLFGDVDQLKSDFNTLKRGRLPELSAKGLAAIVQGLGLGALLLVVVSGGTWFLLWLYDLPFANNVMEVHEFLTGLIEVYIVGHGGLGLLHMFITYRQQKKATQ